MGRIIFFVGSFLIVVNCFSQTRLLDYDFNKGRYYLLGVRSESDWNQFAERTGDFYIDDTIVLNQIKKEWAFKTPGSKYACGYHYIIYICKAHEVLEYIDINLNCNEIVSKKGYFYFESNKLEKFAKGFKKAYKEYITFSYDSLEYARNYRLKILADTNSIMASSPQWIDYEGLFTFDYPCKKCFEEEEKYLKKVTEEIRKAYPGEDFIVDSRGGSSEDIVVGVVCNKSLFDKFNLYKLGFQDWQPFYINLRSYWVKPR